MSKNGSGKNSILNVFDIAVIVIAAALAALLFFGGNGENSTAAITETKTVEYTIELTGLRNDSASLIKEGDKLVDRIKKYNIGTVKSVEISTTTRQTENLIDGAVITSPVEGLQTAVVVVEAEVTETEKAVFVDGGYAIRVGGNVNLRGPGYQATGYIIGIERSDA